MLLTGAGFNADPVDYDPLRRTALRWSGCLCHNPLGRGIQLQVIVLPLVPGFLFYSSQPVRW